MDYLLYFLVQVFVRTPRCKIGATYTNALSLLETNVNVQTETVSYKGEITPAVENLPERDFRADKPNLKWLTDITEFHIPAGKIYLSPVIDCFDGLAVSWTIGNFRLTEFRLIHAKFIPAKIYSEQARMRSLPTKCLTWRSVRLAARNIPWCILIEAALSLAGMD
jgi:transposase InsO family protein